MNAVATDHRETIGQNICLARALADRTSQRVLVAEVNQRLGTKLTISELSRWEHGRRTPRPETLRAIADILGQSVGWFHDEHPEHEGAA